MSILVSLLLCVGLVLVLIVGLFSVLQDLLDRKVPGGPVVHEQTRLNDISAPREQVRSQFAWQSRSHFQAPD
jgi:hypothetical protein